MHVPEAAPSLTVRSWQASTTYQILGQTRRRGQDEKFFSLMTFKISLVHAEMQVLARLTRPRLGAFILAVVQLTLSDPSARSSGVG